MRKASWIISTCIGFFIFSSYANALTMGPRRTVIDGIILHSTGGPICGKVVAKDGTVVWGATFRRTATAEREVSVLANDPVKGIHYLIGRDGKIFSSIPEDEVANHALGNNLRTIGIELLNDGNGIDPYPDTQIDALVTLIKGIRSRWKIDSSQIKRHSDVDYDPKTGQRRTMFEDDHNPHCRALPRRVDPGDAFPYDAVLDRVSR